MQLSLKKSLDRWVTIEGDTPPAEFKIDYPTREQQQELQSIAFGDKLSGNDRMLKYAQLFIKYTVKDWKNMFDEDDKEIKCIMNGAGLDHDLWWALVKRPETAMAIYLTLSPEIEFTEADKKKLHSQESSEEKASSEAEEKTTL